eukprot:3046947-Pleurochrysis_carterae.AAC.3
MREIDEAHERDGRLQDGAGGEGITGEGGDKCATTEDMKLKHAAQKVQMCVIHAYAARRVCRVHSASVCVRLHVPLSMFKSACGRPVQNQERMCVRERGCPARMRAPFTCARVSFRACVCYA